MGTQTGLWPRFDHVDEDNALWQSNKWRSHGPWMTMWSTATLPIWDTAFIFLRLCVLRYICYSSFVLTNTVVYIANQGIWCKNSDFWLMLKNLHRIYIYDNLPELSSGCPHRGAMWCITHHSPYQAHFTLSWYLPGLWGIASPKLNALLSIHSLDLKNFIFSSLPAIFCSNSFAQHGKH